MHRYIVQPGDSPAGIAARPEMAGCPKCAVDLLAANPHKRRRRHANGYETFESLGVGEVLALPAKWFDGSLDRKPRSYFDGLPSPDGPIGAPPIIKSPAEVVLVPQKGQHGNFPPPPAPPHQYNQPQPHYPQPPPKSVQPPSPPAPSSSGSGLGWALLGLTAFGGLVYVATR